MNAVSSTGDHRMSVKILRPEIRRGYFQVKRAREDCGKRLGGG